MMNMQEYLRASPTAVLSNQSFNRCTTPVIYSANQDSFQYGTTNTTIGGDDFSFNFQLRMSARLT